MPEAKTYVAKANGYIDERYVYEGETFTTSAPQGSWMEPVEVEEKPKRGRPAADAE